ncbi:endonuclease V [Candidatus Uabimicrobium sp. HlEnr_7]|uniref:endonuclease V n=1 Tax=Candidatus Uabimicrobium helgolandensis TaxID=3095367 RepID=UPI0035566294
MDTSLIYSGYDFLTNYLQKNSFCFHDLNTDNFRNWLKNLVEREKNNNSFQQRSKIRNLKKDNWEEYHTLQKNLKIAERNFLNHPNKSSFEEVENAIDSSQKAIQGLSNFLQKNSDDEKRQEKLKNFQEKLSNLQEQRDLLVKDTPEKVIFEKAQETLKNFEQSLGLPEEEAKLAAILKNQGQKRSFSGSQFEDVSLKIVQNNICSTLSQRYNLQTDNMVILSNVTLGCARAEIDYLVIQEMPETCVKVLAVIEVKKNINDVAGGFELRQENIHWFTKNSEKYDWQIYRTKIFREGHFDKKVKHSEHGKEYFFDSSSFLNFSHENEYYLQDLFFITYDRQLTGLRASEKSILSHRISTDVFFDLENDDYIEKLFTWCCERFSTLQTKNVLEFYLQNNYADNMVVVNNPKKDDRDIRKHLAKEQEKLLPMVSIPVKGGYSPVKQDYVFAFDIQYQGEEAHVAVDIFRWQDKHVKTYAGLFKVNVPYVPSYFCFREGPPLLALYQKILQDEGIKPQLLIIDGHGIAHPRKFGVACWLGIATGVPAIGCAKETLISYEGEKLETSSQSNVPMTYDNENLGFALRRLENVNPVFISPGHLISQDKSLEICLALEGEFKVPDTIRRADQAARQHCSRINGNWIDLGLLPKATPLWEMI